MLLNRVERALMNNPVRAAVQRRFEAPRLLRMGGPVPRARALEIGCGGGVGVELILDVFGAAGVDAFDLDPEMVCRARRRLRRRGGRVRLWVGDATAIAAPDASYDAVFDFGIVHHVPDWRRALSEVRRVLVPAGRFYAEEALAGFIGSRWARRWLDHPAADRFDRAEFESALGDAGFAVCATRELGGAFAWFVAVRAAP